MPTIDLNAFVFSSEVDTRDATKIVEVTQSITTKHALLGMLAESLQFPDYFGANWDALDECLRDLSWLPVRAVVIKHDSLPRLTDDVLRTYIDILARTV